METKDLRIGNLVLFKKSIFNIKEINGSWHSVNLFESRKDYKIEDIEPIPLTEEWLVKFGFKYYEVEEWHLEYIDYRKKKQQLSYHYTDGATFIHGMNTCTIKYVHQLQNLYYALTNKELKLKDEETNI